MVSVDAPARGAASVGEPRMMTGGEALVETLKANGVDTIFGLPGVQLDGLFNALYANQDSIRVLHTRHEQATAYMADGYARVTGREGVCLVVPGPGLLNATAALSTAYACNVPVLCLTGQIRSDMIDYGRGLLHEIPNQIGMIQSVVKSASRSMTPEAIPGDLTASFQALRSGRPRPVEYEVPPDTLLNSAEVSLVGPAGPRLRNAGNPDLLEKAAEALGKGKKVVIYAGGGSMRSEAGPEILELAQMLQAPVIITRNGKGVISDRTPYAQNGMADAFFRADADVMLAVGTRFMDAGDAPRAIDPGQVVIQVDIDAEELDRNFIPTVGIEADAKAALAAIIEKVGRHNSSRPSREAEFAEVKAGIMARVNGVSPQADFGKVIREEMPDDGVIVSEMTQLGYWSNIGLPIYQPNTFLTPGYQGTLGWGFTTAMGAKVGKPNVPVISMNGDGGFGFTLNELASLVQHNIGLITIVFNDKAYGNVRRIQKEDYGGTTIASSLVNPDYQKLAGAFGINGRKADGPEALRVALRESIKADEPVLIEVPVSEMPNPWKVLNLR